ncbi:MAG: hypothetical protein RI885_610 [Actinomycetota bacterium]
MIAAIPLDPEADEARDWLVRELAKPEYRAAEPNWLDLIAAELQRWLQDLLGSGTGAAPPVVIAVVVALVLGAVVVAYLVFGPPRANRRRRSGSAVFGDDDERDAATLRRAAGEAAAAGDWPLAVEEMFRAIARGLTERAVLVTLPGTTAAGFARDAGRSFPAVAADLLAAASAFDAVRYLGGTGSREDWTRVERLERAIRDSTPDLDGGAGRETDASPLAAAR